MNSGIYAIKNTVTSKCYVGSSKNFKQRMQTHFTNLAKGKGINPKLQNSFNKHGVKSFQCELIEHIETYDADVFLEREQHWIDLLNSVENGYNITRSTFGGDTMTHNPNKNKIYLELGKRVKLRNLSLDITEYNRIYRVNIPQKPRGADFTATMRKAKGGKNHHFYGKHLSDEHKSKLSKLNAGCLNKESKRYCVNGVVYDTRQVACDALKISIPTLRKRCNSIDEKWAEWICFGYIRDL